jgi:hypothetical protein
MTKTPICVVLPIVTQPRKPESRNALDAGAVIPDLIRDRHDEVLSLIVALIEIPRHSKFTISYAHFNEKDV